MSDIIEQLRDEAAKVSIERSGGKSVSSRDATGSVIWKAADEIERLQRERDHFYTQFQIAWAALTPVSENEKRGMERVLAILRSKQSQAVDEGNGFGPTWSARNKAFKECAEMLRLALEAEAPPETNVDGYAELEALAKAATQGPHHIYTFARDDNNWEANAAFQAAASPQIILQLIKQTRAAPENHVEPIDNRHDFVPNKKYPWFCAFCGYAPHEPLKHFQPIATTEGQPDA